MMGLTPRQAQALRAIEAFALRYGGVPSYRELARELGYCGPGAAVRVVNMLIERGRLIARAVKMRFVEAGEPEPGASAPYLGRYPIRSHRTLAELGQGEHLAAQAKPGGMAPKGTLAQASPSAEWRTGETP